MTPNDNGRTKTALHGVRFIGMDNVPSGLRGAILQSGRVESVRSAGQVQKKTPPALTDGVLTGVR